MLAPRSGLGHFVAVNGRSPTSAYRAPANSNKRRNARRRSLQNPLTQTLRWISGHIGFAIATAALALILLDYFATPSQFPIIQGLTLVGLSAIVIIRLFERVRAGDQAQTNGQKLEFGVLVIALAFAIMELSGGPQGPLYPLIYAVAAFLAAYHTLSMALFFGFLIVATETLLLLTATAPSFTTYFSHLSFFVFFGLLYALFFGTSRPVLSARRIAKADTDGDDLEQLRADARAFRLSERKVEYHQDITIEELRRQREVNSVLAIQESLYNLLAVAERALSPFTVALLWLDERGKSMRIKELRSDSDFVAESAINAGSGVLGAVAKRNAPLVLSKMKPHHPGLCYYRRPEAVTDFVGVPVTDNGEFRGVLVADRVNGHGFDESEVEIMNTIAHEVIRAIQVERIFAEMDTEKFQRDRFYEASRAFNQALTADDVGQVALKALAKIAQPDLCAFVLVDEHDDSMLNIQAVHAPDDLEVAETLHNKTFAGEMGLVGSALKARHPLPVGSKRGLGQDLFDRQIDVPYGHGKVLPLVWKNQALGALVLADHRAGFIPDELLDMLKVVADQAASALANARLYERMQMMATTDGLTKLTNHRHFQELFSSYLARADRYGRNLSILLTDVDHFKKVNDGYGHPVGDKVLIRVAKLLQECARATDIPARYGGEEFIFLLDETDEEGALQIAERIRKAVEAEEFRTEKGVLQCTLSVGIATFPQDAKTKADLIEAADQALYHAKHSGRNQSITHKQYLHSTRATNKG